MATDVERLISQLSVDMRQYENAMKKAAGVMNREARAIENRWKKAGVSMDSISAGMGRSLTAPLLGISAALSVREVARYADAWTAAKNSLAIAGVTGRNQVVVLDQIYAAAQANSAPLGALANLYGRAAQASDNLGASQADLIRFSGGVGTALRVAGTNATTAQGALTQLGQAISSTRVFAEEFNSINEGARPILMAVAEGLDEAGGSVSKLRQLVIDGKVSGQDFFQAFLRGLPAIEAMAANATTTIEQGMTKVNNAFTKYIGQTDEGLGASQRLVTGLSALADNFDDIADITVKVAAIIGAGLLGRSIAGMVASLGLGATAARKFINEMRMVTTLGGVTTAISGLSAAAGPLGLLIGTTAAGALMLYSDASSRAEERTGRLRSEMEALGLVAPTAADAIDQVTSAVDDLTSAERLAKMRDLRDEIARINGGFVSDVTSGGDSFSKIQAEAGRGLNGGWMFNEYDRADGDALRTIIELSEEAQRGEADLAKVQAAMTRIGEMDISAPARVLIERLVDLTEYADGLDIMQTALGDSPAMRDALDQLQFFEDRLGAIAMLPGVDQKIVAEIQNIIDSFQSGSRSADDAQRALARIADADPNVAGYLQQLMPIFGTLKSLRAEAAATKAELADAAGGVAGGRGNGEAETQRRRQDTDAMNAGRAYLAEQQRLNALTKDQLALETEMTRVRKELKDAGGVVTDAQVEQLARDRLAAQEGRSESGKKPKAEKDNEYESARKSTQEAIDQMMAEAKILAELNGSYAGMGNVFDYSAKRAELLTAAQQAGIAVTPQLTAAVDEMAKAYAEANFNIEDVREGMDRVKENSERGAEAIAGVFGSVIDGSMSAKDAVIQLLAQIAQVQAQKALLNMVDLGGGGNILSTVGGLLGGKRSRGGPVKGGVPYLVNEDTNRSEIMVPSQSGAVLNVQQAQAAFARSMGGFRAASESRRSSGRSVSLTFAPSTPITIQGNADSNTIAELRSELDARDQRLKAELPGYLNENKARYGDAVRK